MGNQKRAFTLIEVVVGIALFTIVSLGVIMSIMFLQKDSTASFYRAYANMLGNSYLNQVKGLSYASLDPNTVTAISGLYKLNGTSFTTLADLPTNGTYISTSVDTNDSGSSDMTFDLALTITESSGTDFSDFLELKLEYRWQDPFFGSSEQSSWPNETLVAIKQKTE